MIPDPRLEARVRDHLKQEHRFEHSVRVAALAADLAREHGLDVQQAYVAGLLHDLARLYPAEQLLDECAARDIPIDGYAREHPVVLHAPLSAALAQERFGIEDVAIRSAIAKHTLAAPVMSPLDCVVYLADSLEPGRNFETRAGLEALARNDLFAAVYATIGDSLRYLERSGKAPAPQTAQALAALGPRPASAGG